MAEWNITITTGAQGAPGQGVPAGGSTGQFLTKVDGTDYNTQWTTSSATVTDLNDIGNVDVAGVGNGEVLKFNSTSGNWEAAVDDTGASATWGNITGTLSNQTDLQTALDGKAATTHNHSGVYEPADATILKDADIGVNVAAQSHNHVKANITDFNDADYATAAQGTSADTAFGWGDHSTEGYLTTVALNNISDVTITTPTNGQVLKYNGSIWVNGTDEGDAAVWGNITGTLSNQTDLQSALDAKAASSHTHVEADITDLGSYVENVVEDTTPQLGGDLDVNGQSIVSVLNGDIAITPNGTGSVVLDGLNWPQADGTADYVLKTDGLGQLSWVAQNPGVTDHGALTGLADDDHAQYHNDARADSWYTSKSIFDLNDVLSGAVSDGHILVWRNSGANWVGEDPDGLLSITELSDVYSSMTPTDGQLLTYDAVNGWQAEDATITQELYVDGTWAKQTSTTTGTGNVELDGSVSGFVDLDTCFVADEELWYKIEEGANWEYGKGHLRAIEEPAAKRYWRILILQNINSSGTVNDASSVSIGEIELRSSLGGADETVPGGTITASARSHVNQHENYAFDNDFTTTYWTSGSPQPQWIKYDFGAGNEKSILQFTITSYPYTGGSPYEFYLQWSDDNSNWTNAHYEATQAIWGASETRTFDVQTPATAPGSGREIERTTVIKSTNSNNAITLAGASSVSAAFPPENAKVFGYMYSLQDVDPTVQTDTSANEVLHWDGSQWTNVQQRDIMLAVGIDRDDLLNANRSLPTATGGVSSVAVGNGSNASGGSAVAIGNSTASGSNAVAIGTGDPTNSVIGARGARSVTIGPGAYVPSANIDGIAVGENATAKSNSIALGPGANASQDNTFSFGHESHAIRESSQVFCSSGLYSTFVGEIAQRTSDGRQGTGPAKSTIQLAKSTDSGGSTVLWAGQGNTDLGHFTDNGSYYYKGTVIAGSIAPSRVTCIWEVEFAVEVGSDIDLADWILEPIITEVYIGDPTWSISLSLYNPGVGQGKDLRITGTGNAGNRTEWFANLEGVYIRGIGL